MLTRERKGGKLAKVLEDAQHNTNKQPKKFSLTVKSMNTSASKSVDQ